MPKPDKPRSDLLSVSQVAERLDVTERTVWNLINDHRLSHEKIEERVWVSTAELGRYRLIHKDTFLDRVFSIFPSESTSGFLKYVNFGPWGEPPGASLPQIEIKVNLEEWWYFVIKPPSDKAEYESKRQRIRDRMADMGAQEYFSVRFQIDQTALYRTLDEVVKSVEVPKLPTPEEELQQEALTRLIDRVLPHLEHANEEPRYYLRKAVVNFYIDCTRKAHPEINFGGPDEVEMELIRNATPRRGKFKDTNVDKDQLWRYLTRGDIPQAK